MACALCPERTRRRYRRTVRRARSAGAGCPLPAALRYAASLKGPCRASHHAEACLFPSSADTRLLYRAATRIASGGAVGGSGPALCATITAKERRLNMPCPSAVQRRQQTSGVGRVGSIRHRRAVCIPWAGGPCCATGRSVRAGAVPATLTAKRSDAKPTAAPPPCARKSRPAATPAPGRHTPRASPWAARRTSRPWPWPQQCPRPGGGG